MTRNQVLAVLEKAIFWGLACDGRKKPGAVIESLSKEDREVLKSLTSADTQDQRPGLLP